MAWREGAYLVAIARECTRLADEKPPVHKVEIAPARLAVTNHVAADDPKLWGWVIFPPGFRAPALMDLARRQSWTIKPALLDPAALKP